MSVPVSARADIFPGPVYPGMKIGLLGGSFNPAHEGHRHISLIALRRLGLDQVWWLVSPQNPLKANDQMAPFDERFEGARACARHPRIKVSDLESRLGTQYTAHMVKALKARAGGARFVWLMGADNLQQFDEWRDWREIAQSLPICVIARPGYERATLGATFAKVYGAVRLDSSDARLLPSLQAPAWTILQERLSDISSTDIRARKGSA